MKKALLFLTLWLWTAVVLADYPEHVRLTNLPHVYIDTFNGRNPTSKNTMVYARLWYVDEQDDVSYYDSLQIRVRGNSTANLAKKPYKLKFANKVKLLGKGRANTKKWTLLANHGDKTLLRNAITSLMGERAGLPFNPAAKFVDLTMNGEYIGNYQISDQVDVRPHRVNVTEQDLPLTDESNVSGGYLLEADGFTDFSTWPQGTNNSPSGFYSARHHVPVRIHYPDEEDIAVPQYNYIRSFVNDFEERLISDDFDDPVAGYRPLVDSTTLVNWYVCTEVSANIDGFFSTYFYKEQDDDRLFWGPLWDYDIAYNNDNRTDRGGGSSTVRQLMKDHGYGSSNGCRRWIEQMWKDPWFARLVNRRYKELVDDGLEQYLYDKLDSLVTLIDASQQLNYERWGISTRVLRERVLYSSYDRYVADLRQFIHQHMDYLTTAFAALLPDTPEPDPDVKKPDFVADTQCYYAVANAGTGTVMDIDAATGEVCARRYDADSESQQWYIVNLANGYLHITNRATGQALSDPSPAGTTATTNTGQTLLTADPDSTVVSQQWDLVAQADGQYNLVSRWSQHAANLSGGNSSDGTHIISYTSDDRDATSANRLWRVSVAGTVENSIASVAEDYALAYDPQQQRLHFGADRLEALSFNVLVYDLRGHRVAVFQASQGFDMTALPSAIYLITWSHDGRQHSVKMAK